MVRKICVAANMDAAAAAGAAAALGTLAAPDSAAALGETRLCNLRHTARGCRKRGKAMGSAIAP